MVEGKQKLRKSDKINFALSPLPWEAWECFWDGEQPCFPSQRSFSQYLSSVTDLQLLDWLTSGSGEICRLWGKSWSDPRPGAGEGWQQSHLWLAQLTSLIPCPQPFLFPSRPSKCSFLSWPSSCHHLAVHWLQPLDTCLHYAIKELPDQKVYALVLMTRVM